MNGLMFKIGLEVLAGFKSNFSHEHSSVGRTYCEINLTVLHSQTGFIKSKIVVAQALGAFSKVKKSSFCKGLLERTTHCCLGPFRVLYIWEMVSLKHNAISLKGFYYDLKAWYERESSNLELRISIDELGEE